jgi:hypothetical protein
MEPLHWEKSQQLLANPFGANGYVSWLDSPHEP